MNKQKIFSTLAFLSLIAIPCLGTTITIQKGDTLTKLAEENNLTIREIMDANNIFDANQLKQGQTLKLPIKESDYKIHTVKKGESITEISKIYNLKKEELIELNNITSPDSIYVGQKLSIPFDGFKSEPNNNEQKLKSNPSEISSTENLKPNILTNSSQTNSQDSVISHNETSYPDWRTYGPLKVNWSSWKSQDGNLIANSIHENGKYLFLAVKCSKRIINRTGAKAKWREWITPQEDFEYSLLEDLCKEITP